MISIEEAKQYAETAGFVGDSILRIVAIALAESGLNPLATNTTGNTPPSTDRGILQINSYWHSEVTDECAFNPACAFKEAYRISAQGTDFTRWTTFGAGPFQTFYAQLKGGSMTEVAKFVDTSQFWPGKTEFACGFYAVATVKYAGKDAPSGSSHDVEVWADEQYLEMYGEDTPTDTGGVYLTDEQKLILTADLHYQTLNAIDVNSAQSSDIQQIKAALNDRYPVIACVTEASVKDLDLNRNPYWWGAIGGHVIVISGMENDNCYLVRDSANVQGSLQGPNSVLPGPRRYDATAINIEWALMVKTSWLPDIPSGFDPTKGNKPVATQIPKEDTQLTAATAEWKSVNANLPFDTGIAKAWLEAYRSGNFFGPPLTKEYDDVSWSGNKIKTQQFSRKRCQWENSKPNWY